jgi:hypothetical protein
MIPAELRDTRWLKDEWKSEIRHRPIGEIEPPELHLTPGVEPIYPENCVRTH